MKPPSLADIAEMKARGDAPSAIRRAEEQSKRWQQAQELCERIKKAFAGVRLGNGIGLRQAQGLDDYEPEATCLAYREKDEKDDWTRISFDQLNECYSSLSFFDEEGMRFHLPAYLIAELQGAYHQDMGFQLGHLNELSLRQYALLSNEQREVVRDVVLYLAADENYAFYRPQLLRAVEDYWSK